MHCREQTEGGRESVTREQERKRKRERQRYRGREREIQR